MSYVHQLREAGIKGLIAMMEQLHLIQDNNVPDDPANKQVTLQNVDQMRFSLDESVTPFVEWQEEGVVRPVQPASIYHCINFVAKMLESIMVNKEHSACLGNKGDRHVWKGSWFHGWKEPR